MARAVAGFPPASVADAVTPYALASYERHAQGRCQNPRMAGAPYDLLEELTSADRRVRERAAAFLGDWLAAAARERRNVDPVVTALVDALVAESDPEVQEEIAHSLGYLVEYGEVPAEIVRPLAGQLTRLDPSAAEHVTDLLDAATWPDSPREPKTRS